MINWEEVYFILAGEVDGPSPLAWIAEEYGYSEQYEAAQKSLADARDHLCERFGIHPEDEDLEQIMNAALQIEKDMARRAFLCGCVLTQQKTSP